MVEAFKVSFFLSLSFIIGGILMVLFLWLGTKIFKKDLEEIQNKIKDVHTKICLVLLMLWSLFIFLSGLNFKSSEDWFPWWVCLVFGWSGLAVSLKLGEIIYKEI